jgi:bifunctional non-homologous end joining protein LigD
MPAKRSEVLRIGDRDVTITNVDKIFFPQPRYTKLDLVTYYLAVADGALRGCFGRPQLLKRFVNGVEEEPFFQKRAPDNKPEWMETAEFTFPSGRSAHEIVLRDAAGLAWIVNLGCVDLNPHPVRAEDMDHPDELRIDLDPVPGVPWKQIVAVAALTREVLTDMKLVGWPKTSGSRGIHVWVRIHPKWPFDQVRRAALALAREVERRAPHLATSKWWKEERHGVFLDYNQNARDRTTASAYSVRPTPDARVSFPLSWFDLADCDPHDFTLKTVPALFAKNGDAHADIDAKKSTGSLDALLELADRQEREGLADAPWPPHFERQEGEKKRVAPSRAKGARPRPKATPRAALPVIIIAKTKTKKEALAAIDRWKERHPKVAKKLAPEDVLVDAMRGRHTAWYRVRINLKNVPPEEHPPKEPPDPDYDPANEWRRQQDD